MGLARRVVRKSVRRAMPRLVRQAMHPARTVKNAVTPRPVKQVSRAAYTVRHPVGAAENKAIGAVLNRGGRRRRGGLFRTWLDAGRRRRATPRKTTATPSQLGVPARTVAPPRSPRTRRSGERVNEAAGAVERSVWARIRIDGPGRPWQRDWALWVLILALPTMIVGASIYSLGPVGKGFGTVLIDAPLFAALAALITLLVRWLRKWRGSRTRKRGLMQG
jgi:hypothetical protein